MAKKVLSPEKLPRLVLRRSLLALGVEVAADVQQALAPDVIQGRETALLDNAVCLVRHDTACLGLHLLEEALQRRQSGHLRGVGAVLVHD